MALNGSTPSDIASLANGVLPASMMATAQQPATAILVSNQNNQNPSVPCAVSPTNASILDLTALQACGTNIIRFNIVNGTVPCTAVFGANANPFWVNLFATKLGLDFAGAQDTASCLWDGGASARTLQQFNQLVFGGATINEFTFYAQVFGDSATAVANQSLVNEDVTVYGLSIDPHDAVAETEVYSPFCDCCTLSNNNNGYSTKCYDLYVPLTWRSGLFFDIPANASFSLEINVDMMGLPNTAIIPANLNA